jgi:hypothetical protein
MDGIGWISSSTGVFGLWAFVIHVLSVFISQSIPRYFTLSIPVLERRNGIGF